MRPFTPLTGFYSPRHCPASTKKQNSTNDLNSTFTEKRNFHSLPDARNFWIVNASDQRFLVYWHFWIGLFVSPVLVILAVTGLIQLFRSEIESLIYRDIVTESASTPAKRASSPIPAHPSPRDLELFQKQLQSGYYQSALDIASNELGPGVRTARVEIDNRRQRLPSLLVAPLERPWPQRRVYVSPERGIIAGSPPERTFFARSLDLHRNLMGGLTGRLIVEFAASWVVASILIGFQLWFRQKVPHQRANGEEIISSKGHHDTDGKSNSDRWWRWRSLHVMTGTSTGLLVILIAWNGLQFAEIYGTLYHGFARSTGQYDYLLDKPKPIYDDLSQPNLPLDEVLARGLASGMHWQRIAIQLPSNADDCITIESGGDFPPSMTQTLYLDRIRGNVLRRYELSDLGPLAQWNKWSYPIHVGTVGGIATQCIWGAAMLALISMPLSAIAMIYIRWRRGVRVTPSRAVPESLAMRVWVAILGILLPSVGLTMLAIIAADWLLVPWRQSRSRPPRSK